MREFGLTGGIGSGKSTVAAGLVARGAVLIDADAIVRDLQRPGKPVLEEMVQRFGAGILAPDGLLDRAAMAARVFGDEEALTALNDIVHPAVGEVIRAEREALAHTDAIVVSDIPLLVRADGSRSPAAAGLAGIIVVDCEVDVAVARLVRHRGFDEADARARIASQASREERLAAADFVIDNSGDLASLEVQLDACWAWMSEASSVTPPG